jgi:hypothetical protein
MFMFMSDIAVEPISINHCTAANIKSSIASPGVFWHRFPTVYVSQLPYSCTYRQTTVSQLTSESEILYDWRFSASPFWLPSFLRHMSRVFGGGQLNSYDHGPCVTSSLKRGWVCLFSVRLAFVKCTYRTYSMILKVLHFTSPRHGQHISKTALPTVLLLRACPLYCRAVTKSWLSSSVLQCYDLVSRGWSWNLIELLRTALTNGKHVHK